MEKLVSHEIERKADGTKIVRNYFINDDNTNYLTQAQSYYSKEEKKIAKANHKAKLINY